MGYLNPWVPWDRSSFVFEGTVLLFDVPSRGAERCATPPVVRVPCPSLVSGACYELSRSPPARRVLAASGFASPGPPVWPAARVPVRCRASDPRENTFSAGGRVLGRGAEGMGMAHGASGARGRRATESEGGCVACDIAHRGKLH